MIEIQFIRAGAGLFCIKGGGSHGVFSDLSSAQIKGKGKG